MNSGVPAQLFGPPTWRILYNLFYVAEGNIVHAYPPLRFLPRFDPAPHIDALWQNLAFVLPCDKCRVETAKYILGKHNAEVACRCAQSKFCADKPASFRSLQDFRETVNKRLMSGSCVRRANNCVGKRPLREVGVLRMRTGCYSMSKMDVVAACFFIEHNRRTRVQQNTLPPMCPNHCKFLHALASLLLHAGWISRLPSSNSCDFEAAVAELHPPDYDGWKANTLTVMQEWFA